MKRVIEPVARITESLQMQADRLLDTSSTASSSLATRCIVLEVSSAVGSKADLFPFVLFCFMFMFMFSSSMNLFRAE